MRTFSTPEARNAAPVFAPDGKVLALPSYNGVHLYAMPNGKLLGSLPTAGEFMIYNTTFSADSRYVAYGRALPNDKQLLVGVWDVAARKQKAALDLSQVGDVDETLGATPRESPAIRRETGRRGNLRIEAEGSQMRSIAAPE